VIRFRPSSFLKVALQHSDYSKHSNIHWSSSLPSSESRMTYSWKSEC
jgi:hypothetical protein